MPNPDKWEEISFDEIKKGDEIRTIITDKGGFHSDTRGVANVLKSGFPDERWLQSEQGWYVARKKGTATSVSTFYRKKKQVVLPTKPFAVVEGYNSALGRTLKVYRPVQQTELRNYWLPINQMEGAAMRYTEDYVRNWKNLKVIHEGVDL